MIVDFPVCFAAQLIAIDFVTLINVNGSSESGIKTKPTVCAWLSSYYTCAAIYTYIYEVNLKQ